MFPIKAQIYILNETEGGMSKDFHSGMRPSLMIKSWGLVCEVNGDDGLKIMKRGGTYNVTINIPYGKKIKNELKANREISLNCGSKIIAKGSILSQNCGKEKRDEATVYRCPLEANFDFKVPDSARKLSTEVLKAAYALIKEGKKIYAIAKIRENTGLGLREAKEIVEDILAVVPRQL